MLGCVFEVLESSSVEGHGVFLPAQILDNDIFIFTSVVLPLPRYRAGIDIVVSSDAAFGLGGIKKICCGCGGGGRGHLSSSRVLNVGKSVYLQCQIGSPS